MITDSNQPPTLFEQFSATLPEELQQFAGECQGYLEDIAIYLDSRRLTMLTNPEEGYHRLESYRLNREYWMERETDPAKLRQWKLELVATEFVRQELIRRVPGVEQSARQAREDLRQAVAEVKAELACKERE